MNRRSFAFRGIVASGVSVMGSSAVIQPAQGRNLYIYVFGLVGLACRLFETGLLDVGLLNAAWLSF